MILTKAMQNDVTYIKEHLNLLHELDEKKRNALYYAILGNSIETILFLLNTELNINHQDIDGETVLFECARKGKIDIAKLLVKKYINVNIQNRKDETALHLAFEKGNLDMIRLLIEENSVLNGKTKEDKLPIHYAILGGQLDVLKYMVAKHKQSLFILDSYQNSLLHYATKTSNLQLIEYLVKQQLNVNQLNDQFETPLYNAIKYGTKDIVLLLLHHDAYLDIINRRYETPLNTARIYDKPIILEVLNDYQALPKYQKLIEKQCLTVAVLNRDYQTLRKLIAQNNVLIKDRYGLNAKDYARNYKLSSALNLLYEVNEGV